MNQKRTQNVLKGTISIVLAQLFLVTLGLLLTGIIARYLTPEYFGLWAIITYVLSLFPTLDMGFGLALRNKLSELYGKENTNNECMDYFCSVFYLYIFIGFSFCILFYLLKPILPWETLFNTHNIQIISDGASSIMMALMIAAFGLPFAISSAGFYSNQETHWNSFFDCIKAILTTSFIILLIIFHARFQIIIFILVCSSILTAIFSFCFFLRKRGWKLTIINFRSVTSNINKLMRVGIKFGMLQIISAFFMCSQTIIVSRVAGLKDAGEYALVQKLFSILTILHFALIMPLWSAYTEAFASNDINWIFKTLKISLIYTALLLTIGPIILYYFGNTILYLWTGKQIINNRLFAIMGLWVLFYGCGNCFSVLLNGIGKISIQIIISFISAILYIPLSFYFVKNYGISGVCLALTILTIPSAISNSIQSIYFLRKFACSGFFVGKNYPDRFPDT